MPTYAVSTLQGRLNAQQKEIIAKEIFPRPALFDLGTSRRWFHSFDRPKFGRRLVDMNFPAVAPLPYKRIDCRVDGLHPLIPVGRHAPRDLIDPDSDEVVGRFPADKERIFQ